MTTDEEFVESLYRGLLDRNPDPGGFQANLNALKQGTPRSEMRDAFLRSREYAERNGSNGLIAGRFLESLRVIGDSHAQPLNGLLVNSSDGTPRAFGASRFIHGLDAVKCFDFARSSINKHIAYALNDFGLTKRVPADGPTPNSIWDGENAYEAIPVAAARAVLFTIGELDARALLNAVPHGADIDSNLLGDVHEPQPSDMPIVPAHSFRAAFSDRFRPMFRLLSDLKRLGLVAYVASITPPTDDNELYKNLTGIAPKSSAVRFRTYHAVRSLLSEACAGMGIGYIDVWDRVTENGKARADMIFDGVHYNAKGASELICAYAKAVLA
jgi:hypothetical protein